MITIGDMDVIARLGVGGMGQVLLARRKGALGFERFVAVKTVRGDLVSQPKIRAMFLDEARVLSHLHHPSIAQVIDCGEDRGALYLSMEYVAGLGLAQLIDEGRTPFPPGVVARMGAEICRGLHAAHELEDLDGRALKVVHRDVSPQNLMLTFDGRMKILDFGIALIRDRNASTTNLGVVKGKIGYLAPEQFTKASVDRRTDLYSLSVVLYELVTGRRLFGDSLKALADPDYRTRIPKPSSLVKGLPRSYDQVLLRGLKPNPEERFSDAREMAVALESVVNEIGGETVEEFALRTLAADREKQRVWVRSLGGGDRKLAQFEESFWKGDERSAAGEVEAVEPPPPVARQMKDRQKTRRAFWAFAGVALALGVSLGVLGPKWQRATSVPMVVSIAPPLQRPAVHVPPALFNDPVPAPQPEAEPEPEPESEPESEAEPTPPPPVRAEKVELPPKKAPPKKHAKKRSKKKKRRVARHHGFGRLSIYARAGGKIYAGGKRIGTTPLRGARLRTGKHTLALVRKGDKRPRWVRKVTIREGKHVRIALR